MVAIVNTGGHDPRIAENVHTHVSLQSLADDLRLTHQTFRANDFHPSKLSPDTSVLFLLSVPDKLKQDLLSSASLLIYTPQNEHFGIVPLEAMLASVPVLAANEGGPLETVVEGKTGWLRDIRKAGDWTIIMQKVMDFSSGDNGRRLLKNMGENGRERVVEVFSKESMAARLDASLDEVQKGKAGERGAAKWVWVSLAVTVFAIVLGWVLTEALFFALRKSAGGRADVAMGTAASSALSSAAATAVSKARAEL